MKSVRIGNDIHIQWSLLNEGEQFFLEEKDVTIYQSCKYETRKITDFSVSGSTVTWTFFGKEQKYTGTYSVQLVINEGKENMVTTDVRKFVNITPHCCDVDDSDEQDFVVESVHLQTEVNFVSMMVDDELSEESGNAIANRAVANALKEKQDALVSGENIKTINGQSLLGKGNIEIQGGGAGLKYAVERTVYLNKLVIGEYVEEGEITEEERAYNAETYIKTWNDGNVVIAFEGGFLTYVFSTNTPSTGEGKVMFNVVVEIQDVLVSYTVTIYYNGDATVEAKEVQTSGGSIDPELLEDYLPMAREFSDDFNNDFAR